MEEIRPAVPLHQALEDQAKLVAQQRGISMQELLRQEEAKRDAARLLSGASSSSGRIRALFDYVGCVR